ncbi:MAG: hypothetical protein CMJ78_22790 [Planctomycetaceae bacterium]|nr:hypothetical protein [Planctomycetaceae bacterium]
MDVDDVLTASNQTVSDYESDAATESNCEGGSFTDDSCSDGKCPLLPKLTWPALDFLNDGTVDGSSMNGDGSNAWDTLEIFMGLHGTKQPRELGLNAHMGGRFHVNWGFPILDDYGFGGQIGTALNYTDNAVKAFELLENDKGRLENFTTVGVFQRTEWGINWGIAYDFLFQESFDEFTLGQWRGRVGLQLSETDEFGGYITFHPNDDTGTFRGLRNFLGLTPNPRSITLEPIIQGGFFWRHTWDHQAETTTYIGLAEDHNDSVFILDEGNGTTENRLVFGADVHIPLNNYIAIFGESNFITPSDSGTVDATLGFAIYPNGGAYGARKKKYAPYQTLGNNPSMSVDSRFR